MDVLHWQTARTAGYETDSAATRQLDGVPLARLRYWFEHERLPPGWTPYHTTTLKETIGTINRLRSAMGALRKDAKRARGAEKTTLEGEAGAEGGEGGRERARRERACL